MKLVKEGTEENLVVNGDFEKPAVGTKWTKTNNLPGWQGKNVEVGWGKIYNSNWNSAVVELDSNQNYEISQKWNFDEECNLGTPSITSSPQDYSSLKV